MISKSEMAGTKRWRVRSSCGKLNRSCAIFCVAFGITAAHASMPPGLREALAEFETGAIGARPCAGDRFVGSRKEISRFQILPSVWGHYSSSSRYQDPTIAWSVTARILADRQATFRRATGRECDAFDIYVLWNAPGQYQRAKWDRRKISPVVRDRARRFANLMEERTRRLTAPMLARN